MGVTVRIVTPKFYNCGICGCWHPAEWDGDCREDKNRFALDEIEAKYGEEWEEVEMESL